MSTLKSNMPTLKALPLAALLAAATFGAALAADDNKNGLGARPGLGQPITDADIKPWDITVLPDGTNLPPGSGTAALGAKVYVDKGCQQCHGEGAKGGSNPALITEQKMIPGDIFSNKTIKNFWANSTTIFDYIRRAMPWNAPRTLTDEEVYALTAYILAGNKLIEETAVMDAKSLPQVKMPNRDNFILRFPERI
jgi:mono/diheme cytochrome c family protein